MKVTFINNAAADSSFAVEWNGGESGRTVVLAANGSATIDMGNTSAPSGTSCWARAYVQGGPNHDSGQNFNVGSDDVTYRLTGGVDNVSFAMS